MNTIITNVSQTSGNFQTSFSYKLNASFSGISGTNNNFKIKFFVPDYINLTLDNFNNPIKNIYEETLDNGKNIILDLGIINDLGISFSYGFSASFKIGTPNNMSYINKAILFINETEDTSYESSEIKLILNPNFIITRTRVLPLIDPTSGGSIFYKVTLENTNDIGALINNVNIYYPSTNGLTIDLTYPIVGFDKSDNGFKDTSKDNILGIVENNNLTFNIDSYYGQRYEFIYKCNISNELDITDTITSYGYLNSFNNSEYINEDTTTLSQSIKDASINIYAPKYSLNNKYINYELSLTNTGNVLIDNANLTHTLSNDISYYKFSTGNFIYSNILEETNFEYTINYTTNLNNSGTFGIFKSNQNNDISLDFLINNNDNLATITYIIPSLYVGVKTSTPVSIDGTVKESVFNNKEVLTTLNLVATGLSKTSSKTTIISDTYFINPIISSDKKNKSLIPGDKVKYTTGFNCTNSRINKPIISFILPSKLKYIGNENITVYKDYSESNISPVVPEINIINNVNSNNDSLIIYKFDFEFNQKTRFRMTFDTEVNIGAIGEFNSFFIMSSSNSTTDVSNKYNNDTILKYIDSIYDFKESSSLKNMIDFYVGIKSNKKVKGELDTEYTEEPLVGKTYEGGLINYQISITNIGNANISKIEIIDILPHINDTGIIITNKKRNSEFNVYTINEVSAYIKDLNNETKTSTFDIYYSNSYDPVRFGPTFNTIGKDNNWRKTIDNDLSNIKSIKLITNNDILLPNETLEINLYTKAPISVLPNLTAWNTFASSVTYLDINNKPQNLLAVEPEKVGITIVNNIENKGIINGLTWFDEDKDGLYKDSEIGINGIGILLVDEFNIVRNYTFTSYNFSDKKGYFSFNNIDYGKYYLKFFNYTNYEFTKLVLNNFIGNKVNNETNDTSLYELNSNNKEIFVYSGVINKSKISIDKLLEVNKSVNTTVKNIIKNQMLITMKTEDTKLLIKK